MSTVLLIVRKIGAFYKVYAIQPDGYKKVWLFKNIDYTSKVVAYRALRRTYASGKKVSCGFVVPADDFYKGERCAAQFPQQPLTVGAANGK